MHLFGTALPWYVGAYGAVLWATAITLYAIVYRITWNSPHKRPWKNCI